MMGMMRDGCVGEQPYGVGGFDHLPEELPFSGRTGTRWYTLGKSADFQPTKSSRPRNTLRARSKASQGRSMT